MRLEKKLEALVLPASGGAFAVEIRDVSPTGLSFESSTYIRRESTVTVKFSTAETEAAFFTASVRGKVVWTRRSPTRKDAVTCGLTFESMTLPLHMALIRFLFDHYGLQFKDPQDKRGGVRVMLGTPVPMEVVNREGLSVKIQLKDISASGVRFFADELIDVREVIGLTLRATDRTGIDCEAMVVWVRRLRGGRYDVGARFRMLGETDKTRLIELLTRMGRPRDLEERDKPEAQMRPWMPRLDEAERRAAQVPWLNPPSVEES